MPSGYKGRLSPECAVLMASHSARPCCARSAPCSKARPAGGLFWFWTIGLFRYSEECDTFFHRDQSCSSRSSSVPGFAWHEKSSQRQKNIGPLDSSQDQKHAPRPGVKTAYQARITGSSGRRSARPGGGARQGRANEDADLSGAPEVNRQSSPPVETCPERPCARIHEIPRKQMEEQKPRFSCGLSTVCGRDCERSVFLAADLCIDSYLFVYNLPIQGMCINRFIRYVNVLHVGAFLSLLTAPFYICNVFSAEQVPELSRATKKEKVCLPNAEFFVQANSIDATQPNWIHVLHLANRLSLRQKKKKLETWTHNGLLGRGARQGRGAGSGREDS